MELSTPVAFVPSTDLDRSRRFYEDLLGLRVVSQDGFAVVAQSGPVAIRITNVGGEFRAQPFTILGWQVADLHAAIAELSRSGVQFTRYDGMGQDDDGVWTAPDGTGVAWFTDPDGNTLSLDSPA
jgi:catechol 2,3-dioxygenase-like lactoylglutathione lyase family enzyme